MLAVENGGRFDDRYEVCIGELLNGCFNTYLFCLNCIKLDYIY
jgi:hypothetical protein